MSPPFLLLIDLQINFILRGSNSFEYDPEGDEEYEGFFNARCEDIAALGQKSLNCLLDHLNEEVFGTKRKEATAEQRRQKEFSKRQLEEIKAQAAIEDAEEEDAEEENPDGQQGEDNQQGGSKQGNTSDQQNGDGGED